MTVKILKYAESGKSDNGRWSVRLSLPYFEDCENAGNCNDFYSRLTSCIKEYASENGYNITLEMSISHNSDEMVSAAGDLLCYKDKELYAMLRISDNRDGFGRMIPTPKKIKKYQKSGGWYRSGKEYIVYENCYERGMEHGVRRSLYHELIPQRIIEI